MINGSCEAAREAFVPSRISQVENRHEEIAGRIQALVERLDTVLMPATPRETCDKTASISPVMPPMAERLESLTKRQDYAISQLSDILSRLEL